MKVFQGEEGLTHTFQNNFPKETECCRCKGTSRIAFVCFEDDKPYLCDMHENKGKGSFWLHDACSVAVYFCKDCLEPTALYNQG